MRRTASARGLRGVAAGALTTFLALLFHVLGGGAAPGALPVGLCLLATVWVSVLIGRRRPSLPLLVAAVTVSQLVLHTAFALATGSAAVVETGGHQGHVGASLAVAHGHAGQSMWLAHAVAGVLTVAAIRRGEAMLRRIAKAAGIAVAALLRLALPLPAPLRRPARPAPVLAVASLPASRPFGSVVVRRGPPALAG